MGEGAARVAVKAFGETAKQVVSGSESLSVVEGTLAKAGIDTFTDTAIDALRGKEVKTKKAFKNGLKNLAKQTASSAIGEPHSAVGQVGKQLVDDSVSEIVDKKFE